MKKCMIVILLMVTATGNAQNSNSSKKKRTTDFGIKAGYNYVNISNAAAINGSSSSGFHAGIFCGQANTGSTFTESAELLFSRQGYNYKTNSNTGKVNLNYLLLTEITNIRIAEILKLQLGLQLGYLMNAKADSSQSSSSNITYNKIMDYYNRIEFSIAGGIELNPVDHLLIGARYTIGLNNMNRKVNTSIPIPPFIPSTSGINLKNNILQLYIGFKF